MWKLEIYRDISAKWRWRLRAGNGAIVGGSEESFASRQNAVRAAVAVQRNMGGAKLVATPDPDDVLRRALVRTAERQAAQESALANLLRG
jgi:uncharacterized protein YegP (UPF0339 family)